MKHSFFKFLVCATAIAFLASCNKKQEQLSKWQVFSPDSSLFATIQLGENGTLSYSVASSKDGKTDTIINASPLGLVRADQSFDNGLALVDASAVNAIDEKYTMMTGKRKENINKANEITLTFKNNKDSKIKIVFRARETAPSRYHAQTSVRRRTGSAGIRPA